MGQGESTCPGPPTDGVQALNQALLDAELAAPADPAVAAELVALRGRQHHSVGSGTS